MMQSGATARDLARSAESSACARGAVPDFDTLYEQFADFVWRNARRLGTAPSALDDVVQDVFLVAHRKLGELAQPESLRAWMLSVVIRVVRDHRRGIKRKDPRRRSTAEVVEPDLLADPRAQDPHRSAEQREALRVLYEVLSQLDDPKREVFVLAELEELTATEIANVLSENVNTVHSRLRAARKEFDQAVRRHRSRDQWRFE